MNKPVLSVCIITYNHAKYIRECIDSILEQKVDFEWQLVIADDCSTDGTREILQTYKEKFPDLIHLILQKENVGPEQNWLDLITYPTSKYMLYGEGDDYFIDPTKLQRQVDFLEAHPSNALCFHPVRVIFENNQQKEYLHPTGLEYKDFTLKELVKQNYMQTNSVMYRRQDYTKLPRGIIPGDWYLHLYHAQFGKIGFLPRVMSVYRRHPGGAWWAVHNNIAEIWEKHGQGHFQLYIEILKLFKDKPAYQAPVYDNIAQLLVNLTSVNNYSQVVETLIEQHPNIQVNTTLSLAKLASEYKLSLEQQGNKLIELQAESDELKVQRAEVARLNEQIRLLHASRFWKLRNRVVSLLRKKVV